MNKEQVAAQIRGCIESDPIKAPVKIEQFIDEVHVWDDIPQQVGVSANILALRLNVFDDAFKKAVEELGIKLY